MTKETIILGELVITHLIKAKKAFEEAIALEKTDITRDASIQRFEFTFELAWKTLKRILKYKGVMANNPRDVIREAAKQGLIDDPIVWFDFLDYRNSTTHTYDEEKADEIYQILPDFSQHLTVLIDRILAL